MLGSKRSQLDSNQFRSIVMDKLVQVYPFRTFVGSLAQFGIVRESPRISRKWQKYIRHRGGSNCPLFTKPDFLSPLSTLMAFSLLMFSRLGNCVGSVWCRHIHRRSNQLSQLKQINYIDSCTMIIIPCFYVMFHVIPCCSMFSFMFYVNKNH